MCGVWSEGLDVFRLVRFYKICKCVGIDWKYVEVVIVIEDWCEVVEINC